MKKLRMFAVLLAVIVLVSSVSAQALATDSIIISISTPDQLLRFAERCRLDSWSQGKTVVLLNDIDLTGCSFEPIPTFGGTFEGGGYTIRGLSLTEGGSAVGGLFRYVQNGAVIRELNVEGEIAPETNAESLGGIAGENSGKIINCSFTGNVSGSSDIGGIVGLNNPSGEVYGCHSMGTVSGEHYTGGIAGRNLGSIINCTNFSAVNTTNSEMQTEELDINWDDLSSTENTAVHTDTGGITGFSQGILEGCSNRGNIGYPHVGYNVGGVAGRHSGYIHDCENFGEVNGRKDVGGIVGQMVPAIRMQYSIGEITILRGEMATLESMINTMITDFETSSGEVTEILSSAGDYLETAGDSASVIVDSLSAFVDGNIESVNTLTATVARYVEKLEPALGDIEDSLSHMSSAFSYLSEFITEMEYTSEEMAEVMTYLEYAMEMMGKAGIEAQTALEIAENALSRIVEAVESGAETEELMEVVNESIEELGTAMEHLSTAVSYAGDAMEKGIQPALEKLEIMFENSDEMTGPLRLALDELSLASDSMSAAAAKLQQWVTDFSEEEPLVFQDLGEEFSEETARMEAALVGLGGDMERLNAAISSTTTTISEDMRQVNDQFFRVMDRVLSILDTSESEESVYEDMSEEELFSTTDGKTEACVNRGIVAGDVNVGGLVGTIAIEYDLDPEEDISVSGTQNSDFKYFTNAALLYGENYEAVTSKKDCAGGAVGYMDLGVVYGCENYGDVSSTSGDYVGGIAGQSAAAIRNSWNLCTLSGLDYVGGIAGSGTDISSCRSIAQISSGGWQGAIAGEALGKLSENYFVGRYQGGIDGISYAGIAEPQEYSEFILAENLPEEFLNFNLAFVAGNMTVKKMQFVYGESINVEDIPEVPEKAGYVGQWEEYDFNNLTFFGTVNAIYTPYETVVAVPNEMGKRSIVLLEGSFIPGSVPTLGKNEDSRSCLAMLDNVLEYWTVNAEGSVEETYSVRYLAPTDTEDVLIYVFDEGVWKLVSTTTQSSYLVFEAGGETVSFAAVEVIKEFPVVPIAIATGVVVLLAAGIILLKIYKRKKIKNKTS